MRNFFSDLSEIHQKITKNHFFPKIFKIFLNFLKVSSNFFTIFMNFSKNFLKLHRKFLQIEGTLKSKFTHSGF